MEEVESEVCERVLRAFVEGGLEVGEARRPAFIEDDNLAVKDGRLNGQRFGGAGDGRHAMGPVEAFAGEEACAARSAMFVDVDLDAVAVELEFVQPIVATGRLRDRDGELRSE